MPEKGGVQTPATACRQLTLGPDVCSACAQGSWQSFRELIRDVPRQPEILVGDEGAVEVARHPDIDAVVTGIVGERPCLT